ncbi:hypothetical protein ACWDNR_23090, partial [Gordonia aichiensis]
IRTGGSSLLMAGSMSVWRSTTVAWSRTCCTVPVTRDYLRKELDDMLDDLADRLVARLDGLDGATANGDSTQSSTRTRRHHPDR